MRSPAGLHLNSSCGCPKVRAARFAQVYASMVLYHLAAGAIVAGSACSLGQPQPTGDYR